MNCLTCPDRFTCWSDCRYEAAQNDINNALAAGKGDLLPLPSDAPPSAAFFHHTSLQG